MRGGDFAAMALVIGIVAFFALVANHLIAFAASVGLASFLAGVANGMSREG